MHAQIQTLLEQPMDRREFLRRLGVILLAVFGVTRIIKSLLYDQQTKPAANGYGNNPYGA